MIWLAVILTSFFGGVTASFLLTLVAAHFLNPKGPIAWEVIPPSALVGSSCLLVCGVVLLRLSIRRKRHGN